jgi:hypothetical protein
MPSNQHTQLGARGVGESLLDVDACKIEAKFRGYRETPSFESGGGGGGHGR